MGLNPFEGWNPSLSVSTSITLAPREGFFISEPRCPIFAEHTSQDRFDATPTPIGPFEAVTASRCIWDGGLGVVAGDLSPPLGLCAPHGRKTLTERRHE